MEPRECENCECPEYRWDRKPCVLRTDPPPTCACGHQASKHRHR